MSDYNKLMEKVLEAVLDPNPDSGYLDYSQVRARYGWSRQYINKIHYQGRLVRYGDPRKYYWKIEEIENYLRGTKQ